MKKTLFAKLMAMSMTASMLLVSPVTAASIANLLNNAVPLQR